MLHNGPRQLRDDTQRSKDSVCVPWDWFPRFPWATNPLLALFSCDQSHDAKQTCGRTPLPMQRKRSTTRLPGGISREEHLDGPMVGPGRLLPDEQTGVSGSTSSDGSWLIMSDLTLQPSYFFGQRNPQSGSICSSDEESLGGTATADAASVGLDT